LHREQVLNNEQFETVKREFAEDWENYFQIPFTQPLMQRAAELAEAYVLMIVFTLQLPIFCSNKIHSLSYLPVLIGI
jgi:hypothetical protein